MFQRRSLPWLTFAHRLLNPSLRHSCALSNVFVACCPRRNLPLCPVNLSTRTGRSVHSSSRTDTISPGSKLAGDSGRYYVVERTVQKKQHLPLGVYIAKYSCGNDKYILKEVPDFQYSGEVYSKLDSPHLRLPQDTIPDRSMYVYRFLTDDLLSLAATTELPLQTTKQILGGALEGLAALHRQNIVHNDIKANNILVDRKGTEIKRVQLGDIEDAAIVPPGSAIMGRQMGNWMWRSPEAHAEGPMNTPSDIFSFGIVCIYAVHKKVIFSVDESELGEGEEILAHVLERQISYFADKDGIQAFLEHIKKSRWVEIFQVIRDGFDQEHPCRPFALWDGVDPVLKDLVCRMTDFDPAKRITAQEALTHPWFEGV